VTTPGSPADPLSTDPRTAGTTVPGAAGPLTTPGTPAARPAPGPSGPPQRTRPSRSAGRTAGQTVAALLLVFVTVLLVLFVVFNTQSVDISLVFTDVRAPLVLALLIAAVLGALVSGLAGLVLRARRRKR
jgi:uncharacterized integral membrane protein